MDASPGGALDWDARAADAPAELPGSGTGQDLGSGAAAPAAAAPVPAGVRAPAPTFAELTPLVNPDPELSASRGGDGPVASASLRGAGPAVLGRRRGLLGLGHPAGLGPGIHEQGSVAGGQLQGSTGWEPGAARRVLQGVGEGSGSGGEGPAPGSPQGAPPAANPAATFGAARLLVRRAQGPGAANPDDLDTLLGPRAQTRAPLLQRLMQRLLQRWRSLGFAPGQDPDLAAAPAGAAGSSSAHGSADAGLAVGKRVMAAQRAVGPPAWVTLASTSLAVAPGSNALLQLTFSGALE